ncbi:hypothetical protein ACFLUC_03805 [Chloroflexota bacterium]
MAIAEAIVTFQFFCAIVLFISDILSLSAIDPKNAFLPVYGGSGCFEKKPNFFLPSGNQYENP